MSKIRFEDDLIKFQRNIVRKNKRFKSLEGIL